LRPHIRIAGALPDPLKFRKNFPQKVLTVRRRSEIWNVELFLTEGIMKKLSLVLDTLLGAASVMAGDDSSFADLRRVAS
jgi:hypothetical protein